VIRSEPVAVDHKVVVHKVMPLSLTFDHRAATGGEAARFMQALIMSLQA
jgi:pyruvate dehydrogenase E2 component (dihydrolipoamide acetyltransferase)